MPRTLPPRKDKNKVPRTKRELPAAAPKEAERVAKVIARAGLGSRREIEEWIMAGRVAVNGEVLDTPARTVTPADVITVDGGPLPERERTRLFLYHKPKGVVTTNKDPEGRTTLFEILPRGLPRLVSVGRLDLNSEGLLLLTNDGGLARILELPETGWLRRYRVRANGQVDQAKLDTLLQGITVDGVEYGPIEAVLDRVQGANAWITVALREGKNREVRNVLGALGLKVGRLIRVSYGPFQLGEIPEGGIEEVRTRVLRDQIGEEIAAAAGADFAGPLIERELEEAPAPVHRAKAADDAEPKKAAKGRPAPEAAFEDHFSEAPRGRRIRRADQDRETERLGTVADRKGRAVKVERVVREAPVEGRSRPGAAKGREGARSEGGPARGFHGTAKGGAKGAARSGARGFEERGERGFSRSAPSGSGRTGGPERGPGKPRGEAREGFDPADRGPWEEQRPAGKRGPRREGEEQAFGGRRAARAEGEEGGRFSRSLGKERPARGPRPPARGEGGGEERAFRGRPAGDRRFREAEDGAPSPARGRGFARGAEDFGAGRGEEKAPRKPRGKAPGAFGDKPPRGRSERGAAGPGRGFDDAPKRGPGTRGGQSGASDRAEGRRTGKGPGEGRDFGGRDFGGRGGRSEAPDGRGSKGFGKGPGKGPGAGRSFGDKPRQGPGRPTGERPSGPARGPGGGRPRGGPGGKPGGGFGGKPPRGRG